MSIIRDAVQTRELYARAGQKGWVLPCFCSENLTTTEAVLTAAEEFRLSRGHGRLPVILAITCRYGHRTQAANYTHTGRWDTGLKLFTRDAVTLCEDGGPFENLDVMLHLDHIQHDADLELLEGDLSAYASVMYDASNLPIDENIRKTATFVEKRHREILIEGACDEIVDATGSQRSDLTRPDTALRFLRETGADLIVCNLGTEHRATGKDLMYHGEVARAIKAEIGRHIVLHGASSVPNGQVRKLYDDGVCKVNIWTVLERDSSPVLLEQMVKNAGKMADQATLERLGLPAGQKMDIGYFTTLFRQGVVFEKMKSIVAEYFDMWYV